MTDSKKKFFVVYDDKDNIIGTEEVFGERPGRTENSMLVPKIIYDEIDKAFEEGRSFEIVNGDILETENVEHMKTKALRTIHYIYTVSIEKVLYKGVSYKLVPMSIDKLLLALSVNEPYSFLTGDDTFVSFEANELKEVATAIMRNHNRCTTAYKDAYKAVNKAENRKEIELLLLKFKEEVQ